MSRINQKKANRGSQRWLQEYVNLRPGEINDALRATIRIDDEITWVSPREDDDYAEYQDKTFLERLGVTLDEHPLESFWPRGGPVWDGLAKIKGGGVILVEAKAHLSEMASSCQAHEKSRSFIKRSLAQAARFYEASMPSNWLTGYYQYANRLAHLYLLRELNGIPAWLAFVCFVNDADIGGPTSAEEWQEKINEIHGHLGIDSERLKPYVVDVFLDVAKFSSGSCAASVSSARSHWRSR